MSDDFDTDGMNESGQDVGAFDAPDLSTQDYADHTAKMTANALEATGLIEIVEVRAGPGQVHLLGRVKKDNERAYVEHVVDPSLEAMEDEEVDGHICKQFFRRNGRKKYGWTFSFAAEDLRAAANTICNSFASQAPRFEVTESPLQGPGTPQGSVGAGGQGAGRKGAAAVRG